MAKIKNPNLIVDELVNDYRGVYGDDLESVVMYGDAVTHEYVPGVSEVKIILILRDHSLSEVKKCLDVQKQWFKKGVNFPLILTKQYVNTSLDTFPLDFLDIKLDYKVVSGEDCFKGLEIRNEDIRLHCERELRSIALHMRRAFSSSYVRSIDTFDIFKSIITRLLPVAKGICVIRDHPVPRSKSDLISKIETDNHIESMPFTEIMGIKRGHATKRREELFLKTADAVDQLINMVDTISLE
ncbi:MAG: hypothetical protein ACOCSE_05685 [Chitinivibrionales bacterium]